MDLRQWLVDELDDTTARLKFQVLFQVPDERRCERPDGGNSIVWVCYHVARHADLALSILAGTDIVLPAGEDTDHRGLEGDEREASGLSPGAVESYLTEILAAARRFLGAFELSDLERVPDTNAALAHAGIPTDTHDWLYRMWSGKPASFLIRWPLLGHVGNHVGEMIATRNRMGLRPF